MVAINNVFRLLEHLIQGRGLNLKSRQQEQEDSQLFQKIDIRLGNVALNDIYLKLTHFDEMM